MKERDILKIYELKLDIKAVKERIAELKEASNCKGNIISDMPKGGEKKDVVDDRLDERKELEESVVLLEDELKQREKEFNDFVDSIHDVRRPLVNRIIRERGLKRRRWDDIGDDLGMDRRTASRQYSIYVEV